MGDAGHSGVREIGFGRVFVRFHFGWYHATIPHDRVFILLLPHCHTQLDGRSNSMLGGEKYKTLLIVGGIKSLVKCPFMIMKTRISNTNPV